MSGYVLQCSASRALRCPFRACFQFRGPDLHLWNPARSAPLMYNFSDGFRAKFAIIPKT